MANERMLSSLCQIAFASPDPPRLAAFYRRVIGLQFMYETGPLIFLGAGSVRLIIGPLSPEQSHAVSVSTILYFEPTDWAASEQRCIDAGVRFTGPEEVMQREIGRELVLRTFFDPEGRPLGFLGWRPS